MYRISCFAVLAGLLLFSASARAQILDDGHVDYAARMVDGEFRSLIKDGTRAGTPVWREPSSVVLSLGSAARATIPQGASFLGPPGDPIWMIPQVQRAGVVWAGWNTEELSGAEFDAPLSWTLDAVQGPGNVTVFQTGAFGAVDTIFASADGLPDTRAVPLGTHAHGNWAFSHEGEYRLTFTMSTRLRAGGTVVQDTRTLPVTVESGATPTPTPPGTPTPEPVAPGLPGADDPGDRAPTPTLRASSARVRGRILSVRVQLNVKSRVSATLQRGGRVTAKVKARTVAAGTRTVRMRLNRRPAAGTYTLRVFAGKLTRSLKVRVSGR